MRLKSLITNKKAKIAIMGMGYVGLPLAVAFAKAGFNVAGFEKDKARVSAVNAGENYIGDVDDKELSDLVYKGEIRATFDSSILGQSDVIIICVPTPLDKNKQPDISYVNNSTDEIYKHLRKEQLIILESTTYPGTTEEIILSKFTNSGMKAGKDFFLAFSPERVDPGNKHFLVHNIPKVIGGVTPRCTALAKLLYEQIISKIFIVSSPRTAEMTKLLENIFRSVNIALVNELAILCKKMNIDIWEVIEAAKTKPYGFMPFYPGPGIGGHCIPLDPFYLSWKAREYDLVTHFIELAGEINDQMPGYVVQLIQDALNADGKSIKKSKVLILGAAYKKDIDDTRESPSLKIIQMLGKKGQVFNITIRMFPKLKSAKKNTFLRI